MQLEVFIAKKSLNCLHPTNIRFVEGKKRIEITASIQNIINKS